MCNDPTIFSRIVVISVFGPPKRDCYIGIRLYRWQRRTLPEVICFRGPGCGPRIGPSHSRSINLNLHDLNITGRWPKHIRTTRFLVRARSASTRCTGLGACHLGDCMARLLQSESSSLGDESDSPTVVPYTVWPDSRGVGLGDESRETVRGTIIFWSRYYRTMIVHQKCMMLSFDSCEQLQGQRGVLRSIRFYVRVAIRLRESFRSHRIC